MKRLSFLLVAVLAVAFPLISFADVFVVTQAELSQAGMLSVNGSYQVSKRMNKNHGWEVLTPSAKSKKLRKKRR